LRILSNWVFGAKGVDKYLLSKDEFNKYNAVYLLRQIKGKNPGLRGSEPTIGNNILPIYQGEHFEVFLIKNNAELPDNPQKIFKGIKGTIHSIEGSKISIIDIKTNKIREVFYDPNSKKYPKLSTGMKVEVNGEWIPFSISINADTIKEIDNFDD
jgi:hypothetical protein